MKQGLTKLVPLMLLCLPLLAIDKKDLSERYKEKYLVVLQEGLAVGVCADLPQTPAGNALDVTITDGSVDFHPQTGFSGGMTGCGELIPEPLHKGEIVFAKYTWFRPAQRRILHHYSSKSSRAPSEAGRRRLSP